MERQVLAGCAVGIVIVAVLYEAMELQELAASINRGLLKDHYTVLGVAEAATPQEVGTAFKRLTSQFNSKPKDEASRIFRASVVEAHKTLSSQEAREQYDDWRRVVRRTICALFVLVFGLIGVVVVLVGMAIAPGRFGMTRDSFRLDPQSLEGKVAATFAKMAVTVQVSLERSGPAEQLGMQVKPSRRGGPLRVESVQVGGAVQELSRRAQADAAEAAGAAARQAGWTSRALWEGDLLLSVNGATRAAEVFRELGAAASLHFTVQRPLLSQLAWVCQVEVPRSSADERWGCQMRAATDGTDTLEVDVIEPSCALERFNLMNPPLKVLPGDRVVAVDGQLGASRMLSALQQPSVSSSWVVVRGVRPEGPRPREVSCGPFRKRGGERLGIRVGPALELRAGSRKPCLVEPTEAGSYVVKEVVDGDGFLVAGWNRRHGARGPQVLEGATMLAVNGKAETKEFSGELRDAAEVLLRIRPPRGAGGGPEPPPEPEATTAREALGAALRACRRLLPRFLQPPSFEERLRRSLSELRCEFSLEVVRGEGGVQRVGLQVQDAQDVRGLEVTEVHPDGLVGARNAAIERSDERAPLVRPGDRLLSVNGAKVAAYMMEVLTDASVNRLAMSFGRAAAQSAPGVWEAEIERHSDEGWGLQLQECGASSRGAPALRVDGVAEGLAVARWNQGRGARWAVEPGDLVVACESEVGAAGVFTMLRDRQRVRLTLLRWHAGPAPEVHAAGGRGGQEPLSFEVTLERSQDSDALGLILDPSERDPTRTVVKEVLPGKLVDLHNRRAEATFQLCVRPGDEVESVNGEGAPDRFAERCKERRITLCLVRRGAEATRAGPAA